MLRNSITASYQVPSSGGVFQAAIATPRGRSTRAISSSARSTSNQWKACPAQATSALARRQRQFLRRALEDGHAGQLALQHGAQRGVGLDGDERAGELRERARELARARGDVDDVGPVGHVELLERDREGLDAASRAASPRSPRRPIRTRARAARSHVHRRELVRAAQPLAERAVVVAHRAGQQHPVADAPLVLVQRLAAGQLERGREQIPVGQADARCGRPGATSAYARPRAATASQP